MNLGAWVSKTDFHWRSLLPRCELSNRGCSGRIWRRIRGRRCGTWLHGEWYCASPCLEAALRARLSHARPTKVPASLPPHRIPLGLLLLSRGYISDSSLRGALEAQRAHGHGRIGYWLEQVGAVTEVQITAALGMQWACPVFPSTSARDPRCAGMLPFRLLQKFRMLPVQYMAGTAHPLYCVFTGRRLSRAARHRRHTRLPHGGLSAWPGRDGSRTRRHRPRAPSRRTPLREHKRPAEIAAIACGYVSQIGARAVRTAVCGEYVWLRLESGRDHVHLLFRRPTPTDEESGTPFRQPSPDAADKSRAGLRLPAARLVAARRLEARGFRPVSARVFIEVVNQFQNRRPGREMGVIQFVLIIQPLESGRDAEIRPDIDPDSPARGVVVERVGAVVEMIFAEIFAPDPARQTTFSRTGAESSRDSRKSRCGCGCREFP